MIRIFIMLISILGLINSIKADTIDYWHVYYNKTKIKEYNQYSKGAVTVKIKDVEKTDSLTVMYFRDTPCSKCETQVFIENGKHFVIASGSGTGTFEPIKISVYDLLQYHLKNGKEIYEVFYLEGRKTGMTDRVLLFRIKFE